MAIFRRDSRTSPEKPPRPPDSRPPAEDPWGFGASRATGRGTEGDPCGSGPVKAQDGSDEEGTSA